MNTVMSSPTMNQPSKIAWRPIRLSLLGLAAIVCTLKLVPKPAGEVWKSSLARSLADANRVVIHDSPLYEKSDHKPTEITGSTVVQEFLRALEIDDSEIVPGQSTSCGCMGEVQIEFWHRTEHLAWLSFHHGEALRWHKGKWQGDAKLTPESRTQMAAWLAKNGKLAISQGTTVKLP